MQPGAAGTQKAPMEVIGEVKIGNKTLSQQDLKRIMGLSDQDVVFKPDMQGRIAAATPIDLKKVAPLLSAGQAAVPPDIDLNTILTQGYARTQPKIQRLPEESKTSITPSLEGTIAKKGPQPVKTGTASSMNLPDVVSNAYAGGAQKRGATRSFSGVHLMSLPEIMKEIKSFIDYKPHFMSLPDIYQAGKTKVASVFE